VFGDQRLHEEGAEGGRELLVAVAFLCRGHADAVARSRISRYDRRSETRDSRFLVVVLDRIIAWGGARHNTGADQCRKQTFVCHALSVTFRTSEVGRGRYRQSPSAVEGQFGLQRGRSDARGQHVLEAIPRIKPDTRRKAVFRSVRHHCRRSRLSCTVVRHDAHCWRPFFLHLLADDSRSSHEAQKEEERRRRRGFENGRGHGADAV